MTFRGQLKWNVPRSPWEQHEKRILNKFGTKHLYAGFEAERIARLWLCLEDTGTAPRAGHTGTPLQTKKKKDSDTPLSEQEKIEVHRGFHPETKERLSIYASRYDVNEGVLLGYILREYYETDGWGYGIEAVGSDRKGAADENAAEEIPYHESDKKNWICDQLEPDPNGTIHGDDICELIRMAGAESRIDHYLPDVLDRIDYIHHPKVYGLYIPRDQLAEYSLTSDDPAIYRKPYEALDRTEKIDGLKDALQGMDGGMSAGQIHEELFDGNGSMNHIRDLVNTVKESPGFTYRKTPSGKTKILRYHKPSRSTASETATAGGTDQ